VSGYGIASVTEVRVEFGATDTLLESLSYWVRMGLCLCTYCRGHGAAPAITDGKSMSFLTGRATRDAFPTYAVPAGWFGLRQVIEISPMSGISNVRYWLRAHGYDVADEGLCSHVFEAAKTCDHTFTDDEVHALCSAYAVRSASAAAPVAEAV
jgi:hypothetical protein